MIDLHAHILPGLDDGVQNYEEALTTARQAFNQGITHIVATPHVMANINENGPAIIIEKARVLQRLLIQNNIAVKILPGAEYYLEPQLPFKLAKDELLTLNRCGKHLLIELPPLLMPDYTELTVFRLQMEGVTPILAHPERNSTLRRHPGKLRNLVQRGILVQINFGSLTGLYGKEAKIAAELFIREGLVHFMASDLHGTGRRLAAVPSAVRRLKYLVGEEKTKHILLDNPLQVLRGGRII